MQHHRLEQTNSSTRHWTRLVANDKQTRDAEYIPREYVQVPGWHTSYSGRKPSGEEDDRERYHGQKAKRIKGHNKAELAAIRAGASSCPNHVKGEKPWGIKSSRKKRMELLTVFKTQLINPSMCSSNCLHGIGELMRQNQSGWLCICCSTRPTCYPQWVVELVNRNRAWDWRWLRL